MSELIGKTIGQYQLVEAIDETGTILVYKGFQPAMNRYVAIKLLKPSAAREQSTIERFQRACVLATQLQHPRILPVYESGQDQGLYFCAEKFAENGSLRDRLGVNSANRFFNLNQVVLLFKDIVEGLEVIHARGLVHGNLKPVNILLDAEERPLLADIGQPVLSMPASSPYLAPEQVQGGVVDRRSDIYALGVILYQVLVGEAPPIGVVVSPRTRRTDLPEGIDPVIFKAMAQNPEFRFQAATEFYKALQLALVPQAPVAQPVYSPPPPPYQVPQVTQTVMVGDQKSKGTNWFMIIVGVLLAAVLVIGGILVIPGLIGDRQSTPGAPTQPPPAEVMPTQPPEQPTQPPEQPTQPPEQPPGATDQAPAGGLPSICGSVGLVGGMVVMTGAARSRRRCKNR